MTSLTYYCSKKPKKWHKMRKHKFFKLAYKKYWQDKIHMILYRQSLCYVDLKHQIKNGGLLSRFFSKKLFIYVFNKISANFEWILRPQFCFQMVAMETKNNLAT